jgi:hypothetical protein
MLCTLDDTNLAAFLSSLGIATSSLTRGGTRGIGSVLKNLVARLVRKDLGMLFNTAIFGRKFPRGMLR